MKVFKVGDRVRCIESCGSLVEGKVYTLVDCGQRCSFVPDEIVRDKVNLGLVTKETQTWIYHRSIYPNVIRDEVKSNKPNWF